MSNADYDTGEAADMMTRAKLTEMLTELDQMAPGLVSDVARLELKTGFVSRLVVAQINQGSGAPAGRYLPTYSFASVKIVPGEVLVELL